jgi:hypothetical protein
VCIREMFLVVKRKENELVLFHPLLVRDVILVTETKFILRKLR